MNSSYWQNVKYASHEDLCLYWIKTNILGCDYYSRIQEQINNLIKGLSFKTKEIRLKRYK